MRGLWGYRRIAALWLACILISFFVLPYLPADTVRADNGTVKAWQDGWHYYCIDGFGHASNGVCTNGDQYIQVDTESELNSWERAVVFWSALSFLAAYADHAEAAGIVDQINRSVGAAGLKPIRPAVTEADLKAVIHSSAVRARYGWLEYVLNHQEEYLKLAGLWGKTAVSGDETGVPAVLQNTGTPEMAAEPQQRNGMFVVDFDSSGADADFIAKVPLKMSADGVHWSEGEVNGWTVQKTETQVIFYNPDPQIPLIMAMFDTAGTDFETSVSCYDSPEECYANAIEVWKCIQCSGTHLSGGKIHPLEEHQRNVWLQIEKKPAVYYISGRKNIFSAGEGSMNFRIYRHKEDMEADYRVQLYKYDYETRQPLEGAVFKLYERFDDRDMVNQQEDGAAEIYIGGGAYGSGIGHSPVIWDGFRLAASVRTDESGHAEYISEKKYRFEKTFCDGHPAPAFTVVPEEEVDSETQEVENQGEIDEVLAANKELAETWLTCVKACEEQAELYRGVHFHWIMEEVDESAVKDTAATGEYVNAGMTESAAGETAYEKSGCRSDCEETYEKFISMRYSYTFEEAAARDGYILHGLHPDDTPVEIVTTDSSQHGANAVLGDGASADISGIQSFIMAKEKKEEQEQEPEQLFTNSYYSGELLQQKQPEPEKTVIKREAVKDSRKMVTASSSAAERLSVSAADTASISDADTATLSDAAGPDRGSFSLFSFVKRSLAALESADFGDMSEERRLSVSENGINIFHRAYDTAQSAGSEGTALEKGPSNLYSHWNGQDGEQQAFCIYDHRTEGEIHINKRDLDLQANEGETYSSYGDTQGDAVLEGAVYGLFAAEDIVHPDGKTGVIFKQNDLVAAAVTDSLGDASFLVITEEPGHIYDYETGTVIPSADNGNESSPSEEISWKGRTLLLGNYYIKELSRSEGYELSVNGKQDSLTNFGYRVDVTIPKGSGSAAVSRAPYVEPQSSGQDGDTMPNVIHFAVTSRKTSEQGYDLVFDGYPEGTKLYRKDSAAEKREISVSSGIKEKKYRFDVFGQPIYRTADRDNAYPKRNRDGTFVTKEIAVNAVISSMSSAKIMSLSEETVAHVLGNETDLQDDLSEQNFLCVKMKLEEALRANGYGTPKRQASGGMKDDGYSNEKEGAWNRGVREGEIDEYGLSGVSPGQLAEETVYGMPVVTVKLPDRDDNGRPLSVEDGILTLLDYYSEHPWYSYGGIESFEKTEDGFLAELYAGIPGNPRDFVVLAECEEDNVIFHRVPWIPDEMEKSPRWVYAAYSAVSDEATFGTYVNFHSWETFGMYRCSAVLVSDAVADGSGLMTSKTVKQNVYYEKGETLFDINGEPVQDYEWIDQELTSIQEQEVSVWTEIPLKQAGAALTAHIDSRYTDAYGALHSDESKDSSVCFKVVLPKETVTLSEADLERLPADFGYNAGDTIGYGDYVMGIQGAHVSVYLDAADQTVTGDGLYVRLASLVYPGQEFIYQDGETQPGEGTRKTAVCVLERIIRQPVKVVKRIKNEAQAGDGAAEKLAHFRFKIYLKSNLERLYRDENGAVIWVDRDGKEVDILELKDHYPALVPRIDTRRDGEGVKKILENVTGDEKAGMGNRETGHYNYEKFFDALAAANSDKWDRGIPAYTSYRPLGNEVNRIRETLENMGVSDKVRQFAIDWYLDGEMKALAGSYENQTAFSDEVYDAALHSAIEKAEDYLKPFFNYDLDRIYAVLWDGEADGGTDRDSATLSADEEGEDGYFGVSQYLPYGTYVVVEQQPVCGEWNDLKNRHYQIDEPKEIVVPAVYDTLEGALQGTGKNSRFYEYDKSMAPEQLAAKYKIRFPDENRMAAFDGRYASALVPWSMAKTENELLDMAPGADGESSYRGMAYSCFLNVPYKSKLRIEKLDSETHENLLHDNALFRIYKAQCDSSFHGTGEALFYEEDTQITGSLEFLQAMGAFRIKKTDEKYSGTVPAGTPVCREEDQVVMTEANGKRQTKFRALTTVKTFSAELGLEFESGEEASQNTGYFETPEPLDAGAYVIAEVEPPAGYVRTKPMAIEIYSDTVSYYKEGEKRQKAAAAMFERVSDMARVYVENKPIRLSVEKRKKSYKASQKQTVTYKINGRIDGTIAQIGGNSAYEYAYKDGIYLGYTWKKGILEYLAALQKAGEQVEIVYDGDMFAGYGYVTRERSAANDENPFVAGAVMTLYEAFELHRSGNTEDHAFEGLIVRRNFAGNVTRMYVQKGYGGSHMEFVKKNSAEGKIWDAVTVERPDTDILYYDLGDLDVLTRERIHGRWLIYGYGRNHEKILLSQIEDDKANIERTDKEHSIFAFKGGIPYLELTGGDFTEISYSAADKVLYTGAGTLVYHLDREGNRDALVDSYTGMAYVPGKDAESVYVWPVTVGYDEYGNVIARDKIATSRVATIGEGSLDADGSSEETGYVTGTWQSEHGEESHKNSAVILNQDGSNREGETLLNDNNGTFKKFVSPVLDEHGLPVYYENSKETYEQSTLLFDRNTDFVREKRTDLLKNYNKAAFAMELFSNLYRQKLYHRLGEGYVLENTWITGERTPNDPFETSMTDGQADILKRIPVGNYIMEEIQAPAGYTKGFPQGVTVRETENLQHASMTDDTTKLLICKIDGTQRYNYRVLDMESDDGQGGYQVIGMAEEGKGAFGYGQVSGAELTLCGQNGESLVYHSADSCISNQKTEEAVWQTDEHSIYLEGIPKGTYSLKETKTPSGFVNGAPMKVTVEGIQEVQVLEMANDHTKVEIEKYTPEGSELLPLTGARFTLYEAITDENGSLVFDQGKPLYHADRAVDTWVSSDGEKYRNFISSFEEMYREYGTSGTYVAWNYGNETYFAEKVFHNQIDASVNGGQKTVFPTAAELLYRTSDNKNIRIVVYQQKDNRQGRDFTFEYQFEYKRLGDINAYAVSYLTVQGIHRMDYLPVGSAYVLVESLAPEGYTEAVDSAVIVENTVDIQRYRIRNEKTVPVRNYPSEGELEILKKNGDGTLLPGAVYELSAYRQFDQDHPVICRQISDQNGVARISGLPVGEISADGKVMPYTYKVREIIPPDGYACDLQVHTFCFKPEDDGTKRDTEEKSVHWRLEIVDDRTKVEIGKKDFEKMEDDRDRAWVEGAQLSVYQVQSEGEDGYIYDSQQPAASWTTDSEEKNRILEGLRAGQTYLLAERCAPEGYERMEPAVFTLFSDGRGICSVGSQAGTMDVHGDEESKAVDSVDLECRYAVRTENHVFDEFGDEIVFWVSQGGDHILRESDGICDGSIYRIAEMVIYSDGSCETTRNTVRRAHLSKTGTWTVQERKAEQVQVTIASEDGTDTISWNPSENTPKMAIDNFFEKEESYLLTETVCYSDGSVFDSFRMGFTLNDRASIQGLTVTNRKRQIKISKRELGEVKELAGAVLRILDENGVVLEEWVSEGQEHMVEAVLECGKPYFLYEETSPDGYACAESIEFYVSEQGGVHHIIMEDRRDMEHVPVTDETEESEKEEPDEEESGEEKPEKGKPEKNKPGNPDHPSNPTNPDFPKEKQRIGKVYGEYKSRLTAGQRRSSQTFTNLGLPYLGDKTKSLAELWAGISAALLGLTTAVLMWRRVAKESEAGSRKRQEKAVQCLLILLISFMIAMMAAVKVCAATVEEVSERQIVVTGDIYTEGMGVPPFPEESCVYGGEEYVLDSCQLVTAATEAGEKQVEDTVLYEGVEQVDNLPKTADITVTDERYHIEHTERFPVTDVEFFNWRWISGFEFLITVEKADAEMYELEGILIPADVENPFAGYEEQLLKMIQVNPQYYRIHEVCWISEPWAAEDGTIYRNAVAKGEKYVADCRAVYGGTAKFDSVRGLAYESVYVRASDENKKSAEAGMEDRDGKSSGLDSDAALADAGQDTVRPWYQSRIWQTVISVGILLLLIPIVIFGVRKLRKSLKK